MQLFCCQAYRATNTSLVVLIAINFWQTYFLTLWWRAMYNFRSVQWVGLRILVSLSYYEESNQCYPWRLLIFICLSRTNLSNLWWFRKYSSADSPCPRVALLIKAPFRSQRWDLFGENRRIASPLGSIFARPGSAWSPCRRGICPCLGAQIAIWAEFHHYLLLLQLEKCLQLEIHACWSGV